MKFQDKTQTFTQCCQDWLGLPPYEETQRPVREGTTILYLSITVPELREEKNL